MNNIYIFEQSVYIHDRMMLHHKSLRNFYDSHWNGNAITLIKLLLLAAVQVVKNDNFHCIQWRKFHQNDISIISVLMNYASP